MDNRKTDVVEIDLLHLFSILWEKALVIILIAILAGAAAFGYTYAFITPKYTASVTLYVNSSSLRLGSASLSISNSELTASSNLVNTYLLVLDSRTTQEEVIAASGVNYSVTELSEMISAQQIDDTSGFKVEITSTDPQEAELIANTIADILPQRISDIIDGSSVRVVDYAIIPSGRTSPSYSRNTVIGAMLGALLVCAIIVLRDILNGQNDSLIESPDDLKAMYPDIIHLAVIPDFRHSSGKAYEKYYSSYYGSTGGQKNAR